ncbi:hypothetical protein [Pedobacter gandavensis]|uniref:hypothetical protein n=1 Tax=Pedobacter gandavensis TaxID=2679963 RepID=UPI00292CE8CA|nr:hypothetical protein [Pedobacter gandavensis]
MVQTKKLSLADLKVKASTIESSDVLEKIQGGMASDCHSPKGFWDSVKSYLKQCVDAPDIHPMTW